jgi:threonyl-tRNA synthetase
MTLRRTAARRADADEEPDHRMIGKMLDNKTINTRITPARLRYWGHIRRQERGHIFRKAEAYAALITYP